MAKHEQLTVNILQSWRRQCAIARAQAPRILRKDDPVAVHKFRGACLRMRFLLKHMGVKDSLTSQLKNILAYTGDMRNWHLLERLVEEDLRRASANNAQRHAIENTIDAQKHKVRGRMLSVLKSHQYRQVIDQPLKAKLQPAAGVLYNTLVQLSKWKNREVRPNNIHRLRKDIKKVHYACELVGCGSLDSLCGHASKLQDIIGARQDSVSTVDLLSQLPFTPGDSKAFIRCEERKIKDVDRIFKKKWKKLVIHTYKISF